MYFDIYYYEFCWGIERREKRKREERDVEKEIEGGIKKVERKREREIVCMNYCYINNIKLNCVWLVVYVKLFIYVYLKLIFKNIVFNFELFLICDGL